MLDLSEQDPDLPRHGPLNFLGEIFVMASEGFQLRREFFVFLDRFLVPEGRDVWYVE